MALPSGGSQKKTLSFRVSPWQMVARKRPLGQSLWERQGWGHRGRQKERPIKRQERHTGGAGVCVPGAVRALPARRPPHHTERTSSSLRACGSLPSSTQKKPDVPLAPAVRTSSSEWASALGGAGVRPAAPPPSPPPPGAPRYLRKPISSQLSPATLALEREEHSRRHVPSVWSNTVSRASAGPACTAG